MLRDVMGLTVGGGAAAYVAVAAAEAVLAQTVLGPDLLADSGFIWNLGLLGAAALLVFKSGRAFEAHAKLDSALVARVLALEDKAHRHDLMMNELQVVTGTHRTQMPPRADAG